MGIDGTGICPGWPTPAAPVILLPLTCKATASEE
jgi:hypothetical protein